MPKIIHFNLAERRISTTGSTPVPFVVTSQMYTVEVIERMEFLASVISGRLVTEPSDDVGYFASVASGQLQATIIYTAIPTTTESLNYAASVAAGALVTVISYQTYNAPPDDRVDYTPSVVSGSLVVVIAYITYNAPPDDRVDYSATIVGGTLV